MCRKRPAPSHALTEVGAGRDEYVDVDRFGEFVDESRERARGSALRQLHSARRFWSSPKGLRYTLSGRGRVPPSGVRLASVISPASVQVRHPESALPSSKAPPSGINPLSAVGVVPASSAVTSPPSSEGIESRIISRPRPAWIRHPRRYRAGPKPRPVHMQSLGPV